MAMQGKINLNIEAQGAGETAPYVLRDIKAPDVFQMVRILNKVGFSNIREEIDPKTFEEATGFKPPTMTKGDKEEPLPESMWTPAAKRARDKAAAAQNALALQILSLIINNLPECENEVYELLANGIGQPVGTILEMDAITFIHLINDYISRDGFTDFFMEAYELLSSSSQKLDSST